MMENSCSTYSVDTRVIITRTALNFKKSGKQERLSCS